jgi:LPXTG-motif cell wall-anchored protein
LWQTTGLEKGQPAAHIRVMEKMTVLALVIAIIVLAAVYLLMRRKRS